MLAAATDGRSVVVGHEGAVGGQWQVCPDQVRFLQASDKYNWSDICIDKQGLVLQIQICVKRGIYILEVLTAAVAVDLSCKMFTDELHPVGTEQNECMMDAGASVQQGK